MPSSSPRCVAVIVAAGSGLRVHSGKAALPKQYLPLRGEPLLTHTLRAFVNHDAIHAVQVVMRAGDEALYADATRGMTNLLPPVVGGATRQASVFNGLCALEAKGFDTVLIHDAARPFVSSDLISRAIKAANLEGAAVPGMLVVDSIVRVDNTSHHAETLMRETLRAVQTPQAFRFNLILDAHKQAARTGRSDFTDDSAVAVFAGHRVSIITGETGNIKMTTSADFIRAEREQLGQLLDIRVGQGFDVHAFGEGNHVILGGVKIPHSHGLLGHSDADVGLHALTDALLGALADGDIGTHFPPSDKKWKGADSAQFFADAIRRVRERGGMIAHLDLTVIGEHPKVGPYREAIRDRIADIACISHNRVGVKATTTEKLGFTGRGEGLAAMASATIRLP